MVIFETNIPTHIKFLSHLSFIYGILKTMFSMVSKVGLNRGTIYSIIHRGNLLSRWNLIRLNCFSSTFLWGWSKQYTFVTCCCVNLFMVTCFISNFPQSGSRFQNLQSSSGTQVLVTRGTRALCYCLSFTVSSFLASDPEACCSKLLAPGLSHSELMLQHHLD